MRSLKYVIVPLACLAVFAAGCGKKPPPPPPPPPPPVEPAPPPPPPPPPPPQEVQIQLNSIYFDYDRYDLKEAAKTTLAANAKEFEKKPEAKIIIEGHCDERGTVEYNLALGEKRAKAAYDYLVSYGVAANRLSTVSYGEERPVDPGHSESAWAKNRRAAFVERK